MNIEIISVGHLKTGAFYELWNNYEKRCNWKIKLHELNSKYKSADKYNKDIEQKIIDKLTPQSYIIALDERGRSIKSIEFANKISNISETGITNIQFILGAADGLTETIRKKSNLLLSFGMQTWPHMLARVMLIEQIYRAQQILAGHPYHRE